MKEYVIIYKQNCGAKYGCLTVKADSKEEAKECTFDSYGYIVNEDNFVKVVFVGLC